MVTVALSLVVLVVGLFIYLATDPAKVKLTEVGRLMFFAGLLAFLLEIAPIVSRWAGVAVK